MNSVNNIKPHNGVPYCKECGKIFKDAVNLTNKHAVIGYKVPCRGSELCKNTDNGGKSGSKG